MIELIIVVLVILIPSFILIQRYPDFFFWLFLMLFFDPGGFFEGYFESNIFGLVDYTDALFVMLLISIFSVKNKVGLLNYDKDFKKIFYYFLFFQIYYVIFYGFLVPYLNNRLDFLFFLQKNRMYFMALPIMYGVYIFTQRSINIFFKMLVFFSITILILYTFTLLSGIQIIPIFRMERYQGSGIERMGMLSYGLINLILPVAIILFFIKQRKKINLQNEKIIYLSALLMLVTYLLTLTRREYLSIALSIILILLLVSYILKTSKLKLSTKIIFPAILGFLTLFVLFPQSLDNTINLFKDTLSLVFTGQDTMGRTDYRISGTGDLLFVKQIIGENIFMGTGYIPYIWADIVRLKSYGDTFAMAMDASAEVPIYGAFFRLGIVGVIFSSGIYILLLKNAFTFSRSLKMNRDKLTNISNYDLLLTFLSLYLVFSLFTIRFYTLFGDFYSPSTLPLFAVILGLFYSLKKKWNEKLVEF